VKVALKAVPQEFQKCLQQWQHHWLKCVAAQGKYFKGDPSQQSVSVRNAFSKMIPETL